MKLALFSLFFASGFVSCLIAGEHHADDADRFADLIKKAKPGDTITLANGEWNDARLKIRAKGTREKPIHVQGETPGRVIFTGDSRFSVSGRYVHLSGFRFLNPEGEECFETRIDSDELAENCRISHCSVVVEKGHEGGDEGSRFVSLYGSGHEVDHCYFAGKKTEGPTLVVWLEEGITANHRIEENHFGPRPALGRNGGETIRIGTSKTSMLTAKCVVASNLFEQCNGEAECISNKSCGNLYQGNYFEEVSGALTLRHGNDCKVVGNVFYGNRARGSGGVRVIGEDHLISGNYFINLEGDDERSALCLMRGIPDSPRNGYAQVKNALITGNVFSGCKVNVLIGLKGDKKASLNPEESQIKGNRIRTKRAKAFEILSSADGVKFSENETGKEIPLLLPDFQRPDSVGPSWRN